MSENTESRTCLAREALRTSRSILAMAESGDWENIAWADDRRQALLAKLDMEGANAEEIATVRRILSHAQEINEAAIAICTKARDASANASRKAGQDRKAVSAYHDNAAD